MSDLVERLRDDVAQLKNMSGLASRFAGAETGVRVKDVSALLADLEEAATALTAKDKEIEALRAENERLKRWAESETGAANKLLDNGLYLCGKLEAAEARAETAERERDIATRSHNSMSEMLTDIRRERDEDRAALKQIKTVCEDNADVEHKDLALRFVHNVAARAVIEQGE